MVFNDMLDFAGIEPGRIHFSWVSAAEGARFVEVVNKVTDAVKALGPFGKLGE
jgi:coenzyme F420-reducing hydrogenase delta subunit